MLRDGTAECEYCTHVAAVRPVYPLARKLIRFASNLLSSFPRDSGCIHWRPVLAPAPRARRPGR